MFPMANTGFFKQQGGGGGFRYLHDEISGGLFAYSHLKNRAAYSGECVNVAATDYGFTDNLVPLSTIQTDYPSTAPVTLYDQVGANNITGLGNGWDGTDYTPDSLKNSSVIGYSAAFSDPRTTIVVIDMSTAGTGTTQGIIDIYNSSNTYYTILYSTSNNLFLRKRNGANSNKQYSGLRNTGLHLLIWTDNGSLDSTGTELYYDDMVTAKTAASTSGTTPDATLTGNIALMQCLGGNVAKIDGYVKEYHQFNKVLSQSEREAAKEILEQYYTFS
jgi:hypothetical protein